MAGLGFLKSRLCLGKIFFGAFELCLLVCKAALTLLETEFEVGDLLAQLAETSLGLGGFTLDLFELLGCLLPLCREFGELFLSGGDVSAELLEGSVFFSMLAGEIGDGGEPLLMSCLSRPGGGLPVGEALLHRSDGLGRWCLSVFRRGKIRHFEIKNGRERAKGEKISLNESAAFDARPIDEGAGGGAEIAHLIAAAGVGQNLGVLESELVIIDHDVVVLVTTKGDTLREGNDHFLSVFECKGEFGHGVCIYVLESCQYPFR